MTRIAVSPGVRHMAASAFWFSVMSVLVKVAGDRLPSQQIVLARGAVCLVLSWALLGRAGLSPWGNRPPVLLLRGLLGTVALLCFYHSIVHLPLAEAVVIQHMNPIFAALLAAALLGERGGARLYLGIAGSLAGVLAIARPAALFGGGAADLPLLGLAIALSGALMSALVYVLVRSLGSREHPLVVVFYFPLVTVPVVLPLAATVWVWPTALEWLVLVGVGVATQLAQVHMTRGLALEPAGRASAVGYIQVVMAAGWGALLFGEIPDPLSLAGAALIIASTLAVVLSGGRPPPERGIVSASE
ncbi:MAG TPA: DMT family transporter [Kofleriaceae bacterium]|nr:DMT family transporter [Kofleriaceae bacterium]